MIHLHYMIHWSSGPPVAGTTAPCGYLWGSDPLGDRPAPTSHHRIPYCGLCFPSFN